MSDASPRFSLPFILPGQAQKELFHNEALVIVDTLLHTAVESNALASPPPAPLPGRSWIVADAATGAWTGRAGEIATWTEGGWRFIAPADGLAVWDKATATRLHWTGTSWSSGELSATKIVVAGLQVVGARQPAVPSPSGGTIIDAEARGALAAVIVALRSHGLID